MLSNAYFLAKFRFDTAENEPAKNLQNLPILLTPSSSLQQQSSVAELHAGPGPLSGQAPVSADRPSPVMTGLAVRGIRQDSFCGSRKAC